MGERGLRGVRSLGARLRPRFTLEARSPRYRTVDLPSVTISEAYAEVAGWRYWSDGLGELHLFCEICSAREFASDAPATSF